MSRSADQRNASACPSLWVDEPDAAVIARARNGDRAAMASLLTAYAPLLKAVVRSRLPIRNLPGVEKEDLQQEAALGLIELILGNLPIHGALAPYLQQKLKWRLANYLRAERRRSGRLPIPQRLPGATKLSPVLAGPATLRGTRLRSLLRSLSPRQRTVLFQQHWQDLGTRQIARRLGISVQAVTALRRRAEESLRQSLAGSDRSGP